MVLQVVGTWCCSQRCCRSLTAQAPKYCWRKDGPMEQVLGGTTRHQHQQCLQFHGNRRIPSAVHTINTPVMFFLVGNFHIPLGSFGDFLRSERWGSIASGPGLEPLGDDAMRSKCPMSGTDDDSIWMDNFLSQYNSNYRIIYGVCLCVWIHIHIYIYYIYIYTCMFL